VGSIIRRSCPKCYGIMEVREKMALPEGEVDWHWVCQKCGKTQPCGIMSKTAMFFLVWAGMALIGLLLYYLLRGL
jgi:hypothetical protein